MSAPRRPTCSQWELDELRALHAAGWSLESLAQWYGVSVRTVERRLRAMGVGPRGAVSLHKPSRA